MSRDGSIYPGPNFALAVGIIDFVRLTNSLCAGLLCMPSVVLGAAQIKQSNIGLPVFHRGWTLTQYHLGSFAAASVLQFA